MIRQIKKKLENSYENSARKCRIDHLVADLVSTLQMAFALEDYTSLYITDGFIESVQKVIDEYSEVILTCDESRPINE